MKRSRDNNQVEVDQDIESSIGIAIAQNYLLMLTQRIPTSGVVGYTNRVFECKTCNRQFPSFQALGGHRASHKKPRLSSDNNGRTTTVEKEVVKGSKTHECSICGLEFGVGQALGGHMRRHRVTLNGSQLQKKPSTFVSDLPLISKSSNYYGYNNLGCSKEGMDNKSYVGEIKTSELSLDLNLTPLENGWLEIKTAVNLL